MNSILFYTPMFLLVNGYEVGQLEAKQKQLFPKEWQI